MYRMEKLIPLIGPNVAGPLGVSMLPRTWLKSVLSAAGMLWDGYFDNDKGFNHRVVEDLGLDPDAFFSFLATMPTYPQTEEYVRANARSLSADAIAAHNAGIASYERPEEPSAILRARLGIEETKLRNSALLLDLDDWDVMHGEILAHRAAGIEPLVPMVSSAQVGLAGIPHLPRLWMKATLNAAGALHPEWKSGLVCGFDKKCADTIGLDLAAAVAYINGERPGYLAFERWVLSHIAPADAAKKAQWATALTSGQKGEEQAAAECIECGIPGAGLRGTVLLNDMVDWKYMHDHVVAHRVTPA